MMHAHLGNTMFPFLYACQNHTYSKTTSYATTMEIEKILGCFPLIANRSSGKNKFQIGLKKVGTVNCKDRKSVV